MEPMITVAKNSNNEDFIKYAHSIGVRLYRFNMDYEQQALSAINTVRSLGYNDSLLFADFQGVKMRLQLKPNVNDVKVNIGDSLTISMTTGHYPYITNFDTVRNFVKVGLRVGFSDDKIVGVITEVHEGAIIIKLTKVNYVLRQNAGVTISGVGIPMPHMTVKACSAIAQSKVIKDRMVDWVILSFVDSADAIREFVTDMHAKGIKVMAKIETPNGVRHISEIATVADGFMLGRGDLTSTSGDKYQVIYSEALSAMAKVQDLYSGVGTFFLSHYSDTREIEECELRDVENVKSYGIDYIMLSKEVVNSNYPHDTLKLLQQLCNK